MNIWADSEIGPTESDFKWVRGPKQLAKLLDKEVIQTISIGKKLGFLSLDDVLEVIAAYNPRVEVIQIHCEGDHHERVKTIREKINARIKTYAFGKLYDEEIL